MAEHDVVNLKSREGLTEASHNRSELIDSKNVYCELFESNTSVADTSLGSIV